MVVVEVGCSVRDVRFAWIFNVCVPQLAVDEQGRGDGVQFRARSNPVLLFSLWMHQQRSGNERLNYRYLLTGHPARREQLIIFDMTRTGQLRESRLKRWSG